VTFQGLETAVMTSRDEKLSTGTNNGITHKPDMNATFTSV